jgi:thiosulfate/3-mercaptopyruvate sulfurtransferase
LGRAAVGELPGLLVDPSWLKERLGRPGLRLVDLRDADAFASGHIPGAAHLELADLGSTVGGLDNVLLPPEEFGRLMAARGMSNMDVVVAYDDQWGLAAARLAWALHYYSHDRVAVLDGGWDRWRAEEGAATGDEASITFGSFEAVPRPDVYAERDWIAGRLVSGSPVLLDTRTMKEFEKGHLPGAIWWDWFNAVPVDSWSVSRDSEELRSEWKQLGFDVSDEVTVYCRSGMRAAHTWLVLRKAGFPRVRLYDGSWQEWSLTMEAEGGR